VGRYIWRPLIEVVSIFFSAFYSVLSQNLPKTVLPASAFLMAIMALRGAGEEKRKPPTLARRGAGSDAGVG
jgi:hypothetical protein